MRLNPGSLARSRQHRGRPQPRTRALAHFLDQKTLALLVAELELLDRHGLRSISIGYRNAPEDFHTMTDDEHAPLPHRGGGRFTQTAFHGGESDPFGHGLNRVLPRLRPSGNKDGV
jgi:hypothetical protein